MAVTSIKKSKALILLQDGWTTKQVASEVGITAKQVNNLRYRYITRNDTVAKAEKEDLQNFYENYQANAWVKAFKRANGKITEEKLEKSTAWDLAKIMVASHDKIKEIKDRDIPSAQRQWQSFINIYINDNINDNINDKDKIIDKAIDVTGVEVVNG